MQSCLIRALDILLSAIALIMLLPVFIVISLLVILKMGMPVVFAQKRLGINGKEFTVYKFRSMTDEIIVDDSQLEKVNQYTIKFKNDPRITPLGAFLRKTSLDELPQIWNVLKGDMSFVGPRPWVPEEYENLPKEWHDRLSAKPGITGYAQISGRSDLSMEKIVDYDLKWVERQTVKYYFKILVSTFFAAARMKNVY